LSQKAIPDQQDCSAQTEKIPPNSQSNLGKVILLSASPYHMISKKFQQFYSFEEQNPLFPKKSTTLLH
jgi:hypothetical protein